MNVAGEITGWFIRSGSVICRMVMVNEPALIEDVLVTHNKCFKKHYANQLLKPVLGNGLILSERDFWLKQRRLIQPAFSRKFAEEFAVIVAGHAAQLAEKWRTTPVRDLYSDMTRLTVQIAVHAFLGVREGADVEEIGQCLEVIHGDFEHRFMQLYNVPLWVPTRRNRKLREVVQRLTAIIDRMIELRRRENQPGATRCRCCWQPKMKLAEECRYNCCATKL